MSFRIRGLDPAPFQPIFGLPDDALADLGAIRMAVDAFPGFPDRITMTDAEPGDSVLLLNWEHLPVASPYRSRHAIFVKEGAGRAYDETDVVPEVLTRRTVALRGIDAQGMIQAADLATGDGIAPLITRIFEDPQIAYIHAHYAARGCFAGRIDRA